MHKCRLCLKNTRNTKCIFKVANEQGLTYAEIINSITNVKIFKAEGVTDEICLSCRNKTMDLWDFKLLVERSSITLQENDPLKRIHFTNISDVELIKRISKAETGKKLKEPVSDLPMNFLRKNNESFTYNDTVIKKKLTDIDFLTSIKDEIDDQEDFNYEDNESDVAYDPDYKLLATKKKYARKSLVNKESNNLVVYCKPIKPVLLMDYSLAPKERLKKKRGPRTLLHICPHCGKMVKIKTMQSHLLTHADEKPFQCDKCPKSYVLERQLSVHMKKTHGSRVFRCEKCVAVFTDKCALVRHTARHTTERNHVCEVCDKSFKSRTHLLRHTRGLHTAAKPFQCELCPDSFKTRYTLKHHMRVHTGERPYNCEMCSQPYSYKHDFNRHCLKKHGVWFKRRTVYVMNEEVLEQERGLMRDLMLRVNGVLKDDKPLNPFEGPQGAMAFHLMVKAIQSGKVSVDL